MSKMLLFTWSLGRRSSLNMHLYVTMFWMWASINSSSALFQPVQQVVISSCSFLPHCVIKMQSSHFTSVVSDFSTSDSEIRSFVFLYCKRQVVKKRAAFTACVCRPLKKIKENGEMPDVEKRMVGNTGKQQIKCDHMLVVFLSCCMCS